MLLLLVFFGVGLWLYAKRVTDARVDRFIAVYALTPTVSGRAELRSYLTRRRRARAAGVLVGASIGLVGSIPDDRVDFAFVPMVAGWLVGSIAVELAERAGGGRAEQPVRVSSRWNLMLAAVGLLWTTAAVSLRGEGVGYGPLLAWGAGALATVLVVFAATRYAKRYRPRDQFPLDPDLGPAATTDAVRGLTAGGLALALLCLARVWTEAVPGPYAEAPRHVQAVWLVAIVLLVLTTVTGRWRGRTWWALAMVAVLPIAWAVPIRLAHQAPFGPEEAHATGQIQVARLDRVPAVQARLGLKQDPQISNIGAESLPAELIGRVDVTRPAPDGTYYRLFGFDSHTNDAIFLYGADGAGWYGEWSRVLPARYSWLSNVVRAGGTNEPMAVAVDSDSGVLWFRSAGADPGKQAAVDLQLVLMLVRDEDSYIYWATPVLSDRR
ncbi:hypothetical protein [Asanoa sp. NPDC050611]|uniref:hypothetical protein n=1 Tax=Asanoa sp. NPDC050611 TaxID=3157098 RepID=UPI0033FA2121